MIGETSRVFPPPHWIIFSRGMPLFLCMNKRTLKNTGSRRKKSGMDSSIIPGIPTAGSGMETGRSIKCGSTVSHGTNVSRPLGKVIGDSSYAFDEVTKQMTLVISHCLKPDGLLLHGWDESKEAGWANKNTGLASEVWSEGLGWFAVLIADVFGLPAERQSQLQ